MPHSKTPIALAGGSWGNSLLSLLWVLVCVVVIIVLAYLFTRYIAGRGILGVSGGTGRFRVMARLSLGREQGVTLVQAGERYLLLGVTASGIQLLMELTREEAEALCSPPPDQPQPPSFRESLRTVLQQRKPR